MNRVSFRVRVGVGSDYGYWYYQACVKVKFRFRAKGWAMDRVRAGLWLGFELDYVSFIVITVLCF